MNKINDGGPAFPVPNDANMNNQPGMSLRDWFAGMALQGMLADPQRSASFEGYAQDAYAFSDAMLKQRSTTSPQTP